MAPVSQEISVMMDFTLIEWRMNARDAIMDAHNAQCNQEIAQSALITLH